MIQGFGCTVSRPVNFGLHNWMFIYLLKNNFVREKNIKKKTNFISWDEYYAESILELAIRNWLMGYIEQSEIPII